MKHKNLRKHLQEFLFLHDRKMALEYDVMNAPIENVFKTVVFETMIAERPSPIAFMVFMEKYASIAYNADKYHGTIMLKLALHRIAYGIRAQESTEEKPVKYARYFKQYSEHTDLTQTDWEFLQKHIDLALKIPQTVDQAQLILFSILEHVDQQGNVRGLKADALPLSASSLRNWVENRVRHLDTDCVLAYFTHPEKYRYNIEFFQDNWNSFDFRLLAKKLGFKGLFKRAKLKKAIWS